MIAEPGCGVFFIRTRFKTRVWRKIRRSPFPDAADHLPNSQSAVAGGECVHADASAGPPVEIGSIRRGQIPVPRIATFTIDDAASLRRWLATCGHFPFGFG